MKMRPIQLAILGSLLCLVTCQVMPDQPASVEGPRTQSATPRPEGAASAAVPVGAQTAPKAVVAVPVANGTVPPIRVSPNGRYFVKADGSPFFWLGDTAWCIFNHPSPKDVDDYLDDRAKKGFTVIQGCVAVWDFATRRNPDGEVPFTSRTEPIVNEAFFKNVDDIVDKAAKRGMYIAMLPFWTKNTRSGPFNDPVQMGPYCEFLAKRYAKKNVFFVLGGDSGADQIIPVVDGEAAGLLKGAKEAGVDKIMITYHPTGRQSSSFWLQDRTWLDFDSIQSGHFINTTNFQIVGADYLKTPTKPTLDMEPGYENITNNLVKTNVTDATPRIQAVDVRRSAYLAVFAGAAGHSYGNGEVYEFYHASPNGLNPNSWHANMEWRDALKLPASGQVQFLRYLVESRPCLDRVPDQALVAGASSNRAVDRIEAIRAGDSSWAFVYFSEGHTKVTVNTGKLSGEALKGWWYNPRTGAANAMEAFAKGATHDFTSPGGNAGEGDWVLVLDDAAKKYAAPGKR